MSMTWGTVMQVGPLRVRLDGDTASLPFTPDSLATVLVGDRVRCEISGRRVIVHGRAGGAGPVGEHILGEWSASTVPAGCVLANGAVLNIADYPRLAAHYAAVYGAANHHGGNGTTTFAVPDTRERTYVNQGGADVFAAVGNKTGAKTHTHSLSDAGQAQIAHIAGEGIRSRRITAPAWSAGFSSTPSPSSSSASTGAATPLQGATDAGSTVQPSFVCLYVIRAA